MKFTSQSLLNGFLKCDYIKWLITSTSDYIKLLKRIKDLALCLFSFCLLILIKKRVFINIANITVNSFKLYTFLDNNILF